MLRRQDLFSELDGRHDVTKLREASGASAPEKAAPRLGLTSHLRQHVVLFACRAATIAFLQIFRLDDNVDDNVGFKKIQAESFSMCGAFAMYIGWPFLYQPPGHLVVGTENAKPFNHR